MYCVDHPRQIGWGSCIFLILCSCLTAPARSQTSSPNPKQGAVPGWKAPVDPAPGGAAVEAHAKGVRIPRQYQNAELILPNRPSPFIAFREFEYTGAESTVAIDLRTGTPTGR